MQLQFKLTVFVIFICVGNASQIERIKENNEREKDDKMIKLEITSSVNDGRTYKSVHFPKFMHRLHTGGQR